MEQQQDKKTDHVNAGKKRGRPKKEAPKTQEVFRCRYRSHVRTYYVQFSIDETGEIIKVESVTVSAQNQGIDLEKAVQLLGPRKIKNLIRKHLVKEKVLNPLETLIFDQSTLLK